MATTAVVTGGLLVLPATAARAGEPVTTTFVTAGVATGRPEASAPLDARLLAAATGEPIAGARVEAVVRDATGRVQSEGLVTDASGGLPPVPIEVGVGSYDLDLVYDGDAGRAPATTTVALTVVRHSTTAILETWPWGYAGSRSSFDVSLYRPHATTWPDEATFDLVLSRYGGEVHRERRHGEPIGDRRWRQELTWNAAPGDYDLTIAYAGPRPTSRRASPSA